MQNCRPLQSVDKDWFMTLESSFFVSRATFEDKWRFIDKMSTGQICAGVLPLCTHDLQQQSVYEYATSSIEFGNSEEDYRMKDISLRSEINVFPPIVLGSAFSKLRHKLGALLHQFRLEIGNSVPSLKKYCRCIVSICTDQGTEAGNFFAPEIDWHLQLEHEAAELSKACGDSKAVLYDLQMPSDILPSDGRLAQSNPTDHGLLAAASLVCRMFPNCIFFPGIKHSMDNCLNDCWGALRSKDVFMRQLGAVEYLMKQPPLRSKFAFLFFDSDSPLDRTHAWLLRHWGPSLKSLRWHAVVDFIRTLLRLETGLREKWDLGRWLKSQPSERTGEGSVSYKLLNEAIRSPFFWSYARMLLHVSETSETLSKWAESCWYHSAACNYKECPFKGARAPELASGAHKHLLRDFQLSADWHIHNLSAGLTPDEAQRLATDHHAAMARLAMEWEFRLHYWDLFPWKLCGLSIPNLELARVNAQHILTMWQRMSNDQQRASHPMTRRFLDPTWRGRQRVFIFL